MPRVSWSLTGEETHGHPGDLMTIENQHEYDGPGSRVILWLVLLALAPSLVFANTTGITAIEELIGKGLSIPASGLSTVVDITSIATAPLILFSGHLADRVRQKPIYLIGIALFALGSVGSALAPNDVTLLVFRAIQGIGAGPVTALSLGLIVHRLGEDRRGVAIGVWGSGVGLGLAGGPLLGAWFAGVGSSGWQIFFWLLAVGAIALFAATFLGLPDVEGQSSAGHPIDTLGVVLSTVGVVGIVVGVTYGGTWGWTSLRILLSLCGGVVLLVIFAITQSRTRYPVLHISPFRVPAYSLVAIITVINLTVVIGMFVSIGLQLQVNLNSGSLTEGLRYLPFSALTLFLSPLFGRLVDRYGARPVLVGLELLAAAGLLWFAFAVPSSGPSYAWLVPGLLALGLSTAAGSPSTSTSLVGTRSRAEVGEASALNGTLVQIGAAIGAGVVVAVFASGYPTHLVEAIQALSLPPATAHAVLGAVASGHMPSGVSPQILMQVGGASHHAFAVALRPILLILAGLSAVACLMSFGVRFPTPAGSSVSPNDTAQALVGEDGL